MENTKRIPRLLTNDERKAAEAAFSGRPLNPAWSESAKKVYEGLRLALPNAQLDSILMGDQKTRVQEEAVGTATSNKQAETSKLESSEKRDEGTGDRTDAQGSQLVAHPQQAIEAGLLIDVTRDAEKLGLSFPVAITKPLWEIGIAPGQTLSDDERSNRLRDILMAFRLRLAGQAVLSPLIDFPAMLAMPPGAVPQPVPLLALIQQDEQNRATATLLLPNEVSNSIIPMN